MPRSTYEVIKQRTVEHLRYWREHNTFGMGEHDLMVLKNAIELLEGTTPTPGDCPVPLPPDTAR